MYVLHVRMHACKTLFKHASQLFTADFHEGCHTDRIYKLLIKLQEKLRKPIQKVQNHI